MNERMNGGRKSQGKNPTRAGDRTGSVCREFLVAWVIGLPVNAVLVVLSVLVFEFVLQDYLTVNLTYLSFYAVPVIIFPFNLFIGFMKVRSGRRAVRFLLGAVTAIGLTVLFGLAFHFVMSLFLLR